MSNFVPNKQHFREVLLFYFNWDKSASEAHRILVEVYGESAPSNKTCFRYFQRFKKGDFSVEDKERSGRPKKYEDSELEALLEEDPNQSLRELADELNVTKSSLGRRLHVSGLASKRQKQPFKRSKTKKKPNDIDNDIF